MLHKATCKNRELESRIVDLEKLCDMQKATIDQQGKALREAREDMAKEISAIIEGEWQCSLAEVLYIIECVSKENSEPFKQAAQKELELFICPKHADCNIGCWHSGPHEKYSACGAFPDKCPKCIPVKESAPQPSPVPTSGRET